MKMFPDFFEDMRDRLIFLKGQEKNILVSNQEEPLRGIIDEVKTSIVILKHIHMSSPAYVTYTTVALAHIVAVIE
jgi:hypothetical protein